MPQKLAERRGVYDSAPEERGATSGWGPGRTAVIGLVVVLFLIHSYVPLRATDLWVHVTYGEWILEHGALPQEDPVMPLSAGIEVVDTEWLSQVVFALVERWTGAEGLSVAFSLTTLLIYLILGRTFYLTTRSGPVAVAASLLALLVSFSRLMTVRPENFAVLAFAILLWLLVSSGVAARDGAPVKTGRLWIGVPVLFALWANLHGSFPAGLIVLGCFTTGQGMECLWRERRLGAVLVDAAFRRWLLLTELALLSCMLNPYGARLVLDILSFSAHENLKDIVEWYSLDLAAWGGLEFFLSWALLVVLFRHSRNRVPVADVLLLAVFAVMVVRGNRFLSWYGPVYAYVVAPHLTDLVSRIPTGWWRSVPLLGPAAAVQRRFMTPRVWIAASLFLMWAAFALSPLGRPVLGGSERSPTQLFGDASPVALAAHLREQPPTGLVLAPQVWSNFLVSFGPDSLEPMVTSMIHLIPGQVWRDYLGVHRSTAGWARVMDLYSIDTVILDQDQHRAQIGLLTRTEEWRLTYEDEQAARFERAAPAPESDSSAETEAIASAENGA